MKEHSPLLVRCLSLYAKHMHMAPLKKQQIIYIYIYSTQVFVSQLNFCSSANFQLPHNHQVFIGVLGAMTKGKPASSKADYQT
jgi:hypothetical protein